MNNTIAWFILTVLINIIFNLNLLHANKLISELIDINKENTKQITQLNEFFQVSETYIEIIE